VILFLLAVEGKKAIKFELQRKEEPRGKKESLIIPSISAPDNSHNAE
jgi:hypothetical protein